ncbi:MAG: Asp-tRNA(Asn)/Glu-tRNA(Gln) amidotransferase subunit GatA [Chloroflexi bacterium]|nr:Asp-tRNA(Asn)/Glu-tRNA(Gln) amidotransferase subunit GatA [Chloroflexota bacterium]
MTGAELTWLPVPTLADRIERREVSPVEVIDAFLDRIAAVDDRIHGFITVNAEGARAAARRAESEIAAGRYRGPLHGIPYALKDIYLTKGIRTTAGSKILTDYVPDHDCTVVERFDAAGAILLGKAHTYEFAYGPAGGHPCHPQAVNPWDAGRIPGGSSSGSGAMTAAGLCPIAMGSCTGGSIRIPASFCGIAGLKPTYGRISRFGILALSWSLDHAGPLGRTVADCAAALGPISGADPRDPTASSAPVDDYLAALSRDPKGLRVGVVKELWTDPLAPEVRRLCEEARDVLPRLGLEVEEVSVPLAADASPAVGAILSAEGVQYHATWLRERTEEYGPGLAARLLVGAGLTAPDVVMAHRVRRLAIEQFREVFRRVDVLVTPTTPFTAPRFGEDIVDVGDQRIPFRQIMSRFTRPFNLTGLPALSVSCGLTPAGLPAGIQFAGRPFDEATVLQVGHAYERAAGWTERRPPE